MKPNQAKHLIFFNLGIKSLTRFVNPNVSFSSPQSVLVVPLNNKAAMPSANRLAGFFVIAPAVLVTTFTQAVNPQKRPAGGWRSVSKGVCDWRVDIFEIILYKKPDNPIIFDETKQISVCGGKINPKTKGLILTSYPKMVILTSSHRIVCILKPRLEGFTRSREAQLA